MLATRLPSVASRLLLLSVPAVCALVSMSAHASPTGQVRLWNSGTCPYAQRVWIALLEKEVPFEHKIVDLQNKPADFTELYASISPDPAARAKVPILEVGEGVRLIESTVCAEFVAEAYPQSGAALVPSDPLARARLRLLQETFASSIQNYWPLLLADGEEQVEREKAKLDQGLAVLDAFLHKYGDASGPYFLGQSFSIAEVIIAPFLQRLLVMGPHSAGYDVLQRSEALGLAKVGGWIRAVVARESVVKSDCDKQVTISSYERMVANMKAASAAKK